LAFPQPSPFTAVIEITFKRERGVSGKPKKT
jgi:hypothetical protein